MADNRALLDYLEYVVYAERLSPRDRLARTAFRLLSHVYRIGLWFYLLAFRIGLRRRQHLPIPVVSIGNITVGGTGKTPMTRYVCEGLVFRGWKPAVLSYGYGGSRDGEFCVVSTPQEVLRSAAEVGDEPLMLAAKLQGVPVLVGKHRYESGMHAAGELDSNVVVMDDGFQVWKLHRDLNIVLVDGTNPFDNGRVLPAGRLREPVSALRRADCVIVTGLEPEDDALAEVTAKIVRVAPRVPVFSARHTPVMLYAVEGGAEISVESLHGQQVFALSSIAHPASFERTLSGTGAGLAGCERYPDHHSYTQDDVRRVENRARECGAEFVVTTEKDAVKLEGMHMELPFLALGTRLSISDEDGLWEIVGSALPGRSLN